MKRKSIRINFIVVVFSVLFAGFNSCTSDKFDDESLALGEDIDILSKQYAALYDDILNTTKQECKKISELNLNVEEYFEDFSELYVNQLTYDENKLLNRCNTRSIAQSKENITIPNEFKEKFKSALFVDNLSLLDSEINEFYNSNYFASLNENEKKELKIQLESLKLMRNSMIEVIINHFQNESEDAITRSPGDRMVISEACSQMTDSQLSKCMDATFAGIALVSGGAGAVAVTLIALAKSLFW